MCVCVSVCVCVCVCECVCECECVCVTHPLLRAYLMWLLVVYINTPLSSQPALFTLILSFTVHWTTSLRLHTARAGEGRGHITMTIMQVCACKDLPFRPSSATCDMSCDQITYLTLAILTVFRDLDSKAHITHPHTDHTPHLRC